MKKFKNLLKQYKLDGYIIPKNDEYFNEYVNSAKDRLKFISNFSGSAGFAIILKNKNYLFVDGRYTIQAQIQSGKSFKVITIPKKFPKDVLKFNKKLTIGFDPKLHTESKLNFLFNIKNISLKSVNKNLVDVVWSKRPKKLIKPFYSLSKKNTGISSEEKILEVKKFFNKNKVDYLLVTAPENIAWILNIRGHDSKFSPIPNARLLMNKNGDIHFFTNPKKITMIKKSLTKKIIFHEENKIEKILTNLYKNKIFLDSLSCSIYYKNLLKKKNIIVEKIDPIHFFKSIKNITEIKNMKKSHLSDGAALTKFLFWIKKNFRKRKITELFAQKKLENFRKMNKSYKFPSFNTISGSGPNTAIIHYRASPKTNRSLRKGDLYLVDSGGQYSFGTTDVTRTISLDNNTKLDSNYSNRRR